MCSCSKYEDLSLLYLDEITASIGDLTVTNTGFPRYTLLSYIVVKLHFPMASNCQIPNSS